MSEDVVGIIAVFGMPVLIVFFVCWFRYLKARMRHKEILAAIEKGVTLPEPASPPSFPSWITSVAIGIGFIVFSPAFILVGLGAARVVGGKESAVVFGGTAMPTLIFLSIGVFFLVRGLLLRRHMRKTNQPQQ
jgi:hypothetical protein